MTHCPELRFRKTRFTLIWTCLLNEPLLSLYTLISFIVHKDLKATALQIAILTMVRPLVSILSLYWSAFVTTKKQGLVKNVVLAGIFSRVPFLFFPWIESPWAVIAAVAVYMMLTRGGTPAWMEILRQNLPDQKRGTIFSAGSALAYLEGVALAIGLGILLDHSYQAWRWLFPICALIGLLGVILQSRLPLPSKEQEDVPLQLSFKEKICHPWKQAFQLLKEKNDFRHFQWAFMIGGFGIMVVQPALPLFFIDVLGLSYTDLSIALSVCKGIGFALSSQFWGKGLGRVSVSKFTALIFLFMGAFPLLLLLAPWNLCFLYAAYVLYGISQSGSHLLWNLSGPLFAKEKESSVYTGVGVLMVGMRGAVAPPLGSLLCALTQPALVLFAGGALFMCGIYYMLRRSKLLPGKIKI